MLFFLAVACGSRTQLDVNQLGRLGAEVGLRLVAPLSTSTVTTQTPTLRWILGPGETGARIDLCRNRSFTGDVVTFDATGTSGAPPKTLVAGVWFWRARAIGNGQIGSEASPVWEFWVGARSAPVDTSWGTTLDVNGDGLPDLAVGAPTARSNLGQAYVYLGNGSGFPSTPTTTLTGQAISEAANQGFFGTTVASAGDLNGDGYGDFVVGSISDGKSEPLVYVYYGGPAGIAATPQVVLSDHGEGAFTASMAAAGDVNGDGFGDLVVGEQTDYPNTTDAWIYFGSADGIVTSSATMVPGPTSPGAVGGPIVASAGDLNGDGYGDVFVGADYFLNEGGGVSIVYLGGPGGPSATPLATLTEIDGSNPLYGSTPPCAADLDGDGYADLVLRGSAPSGTFLVYKGAATGFSSKPSSKVSTLIPDDGFAVSLSAGDVDGDGYVDLLVGSNGVSNGTGELIVYPGGPSGVATMPSITIAGPDGVNAYFATAVASVGDVDGDGFADVVAGSFRVANDSGRVHLFKGSASGLVPAAAQTFTPPAGGRFGDAVA